MGHFLLTSDLYDQVLNYSASLKALIQLSKFVSCCDYTVQTLSSSWGLSRPLLRLCLLIESYSNSTYSSRLRVGLLPLWILITTTMTTPVSGFTLDHVCFRR